MSLINENHIEEEALSWFEQLGYEIYHQLSPDDINPQRKSYKDVYLLERLKNNIKKLNPDLNDDNVNNVINKILKCETPSLIEENQRLHKYMVEGIDLEISDKIGNRRTHKIKLFDFNNPKNNDWLAVNQFTVIEGNYRRKPDLVVFVNGLPVSVIELKNPSSEDTNIEAAYNQLQTYKDQIPSLFNTNVALIISDGILARVGSLTANLERFMPWRTDKVSTNAGNLNYCRNITGSTNTGNLNYSNNNGSTNNQNYMFELETLIKGLFDKKVFLDVLHNFIAFIIDKDEDNQAVYKIIAGYHQYYAVKKAVNNTIIATKPNGSRKVGVVWHTQGSGKSYLMAFYVGQLVGNENLRNPTIVVITDRNDLDHQLFNTFAKFTNLIRQTPVKTNSREDLKNVLSSQASGGVIFATIQKFSTNDDSNKFPVLSDRSNIIVIADEAHRTQYGFKAKINPKTGVMDYGFAKYMRDALPNAAFIGFTGTPIDNNDKNTKLVFGDYIDIYDISKAVADGATVSLHYESRLAKLELDEKQKPEIDKAINELSNYETSEEIESSKNLAIQEALVGSKERIAMIACDLINHFENRLQALDGKGMIVCMSRRICVLLYNEIIKIKPDWHTVSEKTGKIKIVMTGQASDPTEWQQHIIKDSQKNTIATRAKDPYDELKLVIVCDMWLTGFDSPSMHTMYIDKPLKGHGLMQAIARVNRVFKDKPAGLIVDYIGIAQYLKDALHEYSAQDQKFVGIDERQAVQEMLKAYEVVKDMFFGFDYKTGLNGSAHDRLVTLASAMNWILKKQNELAGKENNNEAKTRANRAFQDKVLALTKAYVLVCASSEAIKIRDEVGFFQAVKVALVKTNESADNNHNNLSKNQKKLAIQQIVSKSVISTDIVDILKACGITSPDISILSDEFLAEIQHMEKKHLGIEALKKIINDQIRSRSKTNKVESKTFSTRIEEAIAKYHLNAISTIEVMQELINLAKDMNKSYKRGEKLNLSEAEIAFYDALALNNSAVEVLGNKKLLIIAHEIFVNLKKNISIDWEKREKVRAKLRLLVKAILEEYGYPPDLANSAVKTVLEQAELWSAQWGKSTSNINQDADEDFDLNIDSNVIYTNINTFPQPPKVADNDLVKNLENILENE